MLALGGILIAALAPDVSAASQAWVYVDSRTLVTAEFVSSTRAVVNLFNLSGYATALKAEELLVLSQQNVLSLGQVIVQEAKPGSGEAPYIGSLLVGPWSFVGVEMLGKFIAPEQIGQVILILGGKRLYMDRLAAAEFEELASRVEEVDLARRDGAQILQRARIIPRGRIQYPSGEQDSLDLALDNLLGPEHVNPPRVVSQTPAQLTEEARNAGISGSVRLSVHLSRFGEIKDVKVLKGLGYGLDERAVAVVRNSWKFLPATRNSELVEVTLTVEVDFPPSPSPRFGT